MRLDIERFLSFLFFFLWGPKTQVVCIFDTKCNKFGIKYIIHLEYFRILRLWRDYHQDRFIFLSFDETFIYASTKIGARMTEARFFLHCVEILSRLIYLFVHR